jgi:hypothetical protein
LTASPLIPSHVSPNICAALTGFSVKRIRALIHSGQVQHDGDGHWLRVPMREVERMRGAPVTITDWLTADHQRRTRATRHPRNTTK